MNFKEGQEFKKGGGELPTMYWKDYFKKYSQYEDEAIRQFRIIQSSGDKYVVSRDAMGAHGSNEMVEGCSVPIDAPLEEVLGCIIYGIILEHGIPTES